MSKLNDINNIENQIPEEDFANLFNVYPTEKISNNSLVYSINKTLNLDDVPRPGESMGAYFYEYTVLENESWTNIAYKNYGTIRLWWLICKLNGIKDPTVYPKSNSKIVLINPDNVFGLLNSIKESE